MGNFWCGCGIRCSSPIQGLQLEPYLTFGAGIRAVQVSADRRLLVVETNAPAKLGAETQDQKMLGGRR